jgi:hypothetical protein
MTASDWLNAARAGTLSLPASSSATARTAGRDGVTPRRIIFLARYLLGAGLVIGTVALVPSSSGASTAPGTDHVDAVISAFFGPGTVKGGAPEEFDPTNSTEIGTLTTTGIDLEVYGAGGLSGLDAVFSPPSGAEFRTGYYADADIADGSLPDGHASFDVTLEAGCDGGTGDFEIRDLASTGASITRLDLLYEQHCDDSTAALFGEIRIGEPLTHGLIVSSNSITWPPGDPGPSNTLVPVVVRNRTAKSVSVGSAQIVGQFASDFLLGKDTCSGKSLSPGANCAVLVNFDPTTRGALTAQLRLVLGKTLDLIELDGVATPETTSLTMQSQKGDSVGVGRNYSFDTGTAVFAADGGSLSLVDMELATNDGEFWSLDMAAAKGHVLAPGVYSDAARYPFNGTANGLAVFGDGAGCNTVTGSFTVEQVVFSTDHVLQHFAANFVQHCDGQAPALTGRLNIEAGTLRSPPAGVSDLAATRAGSALRVSWRNPAGSHYTLIRIEEGSPVGLSPVAGQAVYSGSGTSAQMIGLASGSTYTVTAFTVDEFGDVSAASNVTVPG